MAFRSVPRPSSPPGAKASTECPSHTRYTSISSLTDTPCTETILRLSYRQTRSGDRPSRSQPQNPEDRSGRNHSSHITGSHPVTASPIARAMDKNRQPDKIVHTPLNSRRRPLGRLSRRTALPVRHATERRDVRQSIRTNIHHTRPETHQNLIHPDKEQNTRQTTHRHASRLAHHLTDLGYSTIRRPFLLPEGTWWRRSGSNR